MAKAMSAGNRRKAKRWDWLDATSLSIADPDLGSAFFLFCSHIWHCNPFRIWHRISFRILAWNRWRVWLSCCIGIGHCMTQCRSCSYRCYAPRCTSCSLSSLQWVARWCSSLWACRCFLSGLAEPVPSSASADWWLTRFAFLADGWHCFRSSA